jgi:hypothetical protein
VGTVFLFLWLGRAKCESAAYESFHISHETGTDESANGHFHRTRKGQVSLAIMEVHVWDRESATQKRYPQILV